MEETEKSLQDDAVQNKESRVFPDRPGFRGFSGPPGATLVFVLILIAGLYPSLRFVTRPFADNYHGGLTAWFALMSENMERMGFRESRLLPPINPDARTYADARFYVTHPPGDVVFRAVLMRFFGYDEWVTRLPGLFGMSLGALCLAFLLRRRFSIGAAWVGMAVFLVLPMAQSVTQLSMHHAMTLGLSLLGLSVFDLRSRAKPDLFLALGLFLGALAAWFDWAGYFALVLMTGVPLVEENARARKFSVAAGALTGLLSFVVYVVHVQLIGGINFFGALKEASRSAAPIPLDFRASLLQIAVHLQDGFGVVVPGFAASGLLISFFRRSNRRVVLLWATVFFLLGLLNVTVFFSKAPYEDFWGVYWLPFLAWTSAAASDIFPWSRWITHRLGRCLAALLVVSLCAGLATRIPFDHEGSRRGGEAKAFAAILQNITPKNQPVVLVTNYRHYEMKLIMAYSRASVLVLDELSASMIPAVPALVNRLVPSPQKALILFYLDSSVRNPDDVDSLRQAITQVGWRSWPGVPDVYDLSYR